MRRAIAVFNYIKQIKAYADSFVEEANSQTHLLTEPKSIAFEVNAFHVSIFL
jgi:hypothetical protein